LQKGFGSEQLRGVGSWGVIDFGDRLDQAGAFLDTAAVMKHLDLIITSDTAMAHLAGALGVPVWVVLPTAPDWRWLLGREDNPWYPTMRLYRQKKMGDWAEVFERMALELESRPPLESAERHGQRGLALLSQNKPAEATIALQRALELDPKNPAIHNNLGVALEQDGKREESVASFREAGRLKPDYADAFHNLGNVLRRLGRLAEAEAEYRKAVKLQPEWAELCNHLGIALLGQAKHAEAEACFRRSLRLKPDLAEAHNNLGVLCEQQGKVDESIAAYQEALRLRPDAADTHKNLALGWLMRGDYARGWPEYEWRWKSPPSSARSFSQPRWDGRALQGQAVLLYAEQGLGDTIQFVRYATLIQQRGGVVLLEAPGVLQRLLARCPGIDRFIPQGAPLPDFAFQCPLLSLPAVFHTTLETVPAAVPYLSAEPARIETWRQELAPVNGIKIGIAWQGSPKYGGDAHRSIRLQEFEPVATAPNVRLVSLQKGWGAEQLQAVARWEVVNFGERLDADAPFLDTAAVMQHLDLVVTSDTAVAHLAGALGVPLWMAVPQAADWRWLRQGERCAWYPTMRIFRQRRWGDWAEVFARVAQELRAASFGQQRPILAEIAPGELLDKIAILEIKRERTADVKKLQNIRAELGGLLAAKARALKPNPDLDTLALRLKTVNCALWDIEDEIRLHEQQQDFGERFIELARSVYHNNDLRAATKRQINELLGSRIAEVKSYAEYSTAGAAAVAN
jgi:tetratricopeptide (TPR) repeat protein